MKLGVFVVLACLALTASAGWKECENYRILDDAYRSSSLEPEAGEGLDWGWCDKLGGKGSPASPNWLGEGWYRFVPPAGHILMSTPPKPRQCHTGEGAYSTDPLPTKRNETYPIDIYYGCCAKVTGLVTFCGQFWVYRLPELHCDSFVTHRGYCAEHAPLKGVPLN